MKKSETPEHKSQPPSRTETGRKRKKGPITCDEDGAESVNDQFSWLLEYKRLQSCVNQHKRETTRGPQLGNTDYNKYNDRYNKNNSDPCCCIITGKQTKQVCNQWEVVCNWVSLNFSGPHSPRFGLTSGCNYFSMFSFTVYFVLFISRETGGRKFAQKPVPSGDHLSKTKTTRTQFPEPRNHRKMSLSKKSECLCIICKICAKVLSCFFYVYWHLLIVTFKLLGCVELWLLSLLLITQITNYSVITQYIHGINKVLTGYLYWDKCVDTGEEDEWLGNKEVRTLCLRGT